MSRSLLIAAMAVALASGCAAEDPGDDNVAVDLELPPHFPEPVVPADNVLTAARIELGRHLFYDDRLSVNQAISCSSCHHQERAFADESAVSLGATGEAGVLNAPTLSNVIYMHPLTWAHGRIGTIEDQLLGPMFGEAPLEMGITGAEDTILERLRAEPVYQDLFELAYPDDGIDLDAARFALASFVRSLVSYRAPFDAFLAGDMSAISPSARRGSELFYSSRLGCGGCHAGFGLSAATRSKSSAGQQLDPFHNIGLYNIDGEGGYPATAPGLIAETGVARDMGRFRVPTLRNVAVTAPYMHDGSVATLEEVIAIYERGGRLIEEGPNAGDGADNPHRSAELARFELSESERADLLAFLRSLTDQAFLTDPRHASPW
jgi:cytochrome c peroxidase